MPEGEDDDDDDAYVVGCWVILLLYCEFVFGHVCVYSLSTASLSLPATVSVVMV